ncbi:MAG: hypothetical protein ACK5JM_06530 [Rhodoblastus sp.]
MTRSRALAAALCAALAWAAPAFAADNEIRIGNFAPYSGPASSYSAFAKTETTYDAGDPTLESQIAKLRASGADVFVDFTTPRYSALAIKEPSDPRWKDDPATKEFVAFMEQWNPDGDRTSSQNAYGYLAAQALRHVLEKCGADISRENIMKQAASLKDLEFGLLFPGIKINTGPPNYFPITQMQLIRFNGAGWDPVGPIMSQHVNAQ